MAHRLTASIVFGSTLLLTGTAACGGVLPADDEVNAPDRPTGPGPAPVTPAPIVDAGGSDAHTRDAHAPVAIVDAAPDARHCEGGWPTTKGQICKFENGLQCCTRDDDAASEVLCCPAPPP